jgi:hypothetical protein
MGPNNNLGENLRINYFGQTEYVYLIIYDPRRRENVLIIIVMISTSGFHLWALIFKIKYTLVSSNNNYF